MTKEETKRQLILKDPNIYKGLIILAFPLMINNLIKTLHDIVDMFFVSRIDGVRSSDAVASIQLTFPVMFTFISLGIGIMIAATALISQALGANDKPQAKRIGADIFMLAILSGLVFAIVGFIFAPYVMRWMGATGYILENSVAYLRIRVFEFPVLFGFFAYMGTRQASGDTVSPVLISGSAILLNIILSPIFILVFNFGVPGAAFATLLANYLIMPFGFYRLFNAKDGVQIDFLEVINPKLLKKKVTNIILIVKTAVPASVGQAITAIGFGVMNGVIYSYGPETVAAFGLGNRLLSMILHPVMATGAILAAFIGQNIGAQNPARAKETFRKNMILSVGIMSFGSMVIIFFRAPLAGLFLGDDPVALKLTIDYMFFILLGLPLMAVFQTFIGTYNGTGNTHYTFILSVTRLWVIRLPLVIFMGYFWPNRGSQVIWEAMLISNLLIAFLGFILYLRIDFKPKIKVDKVEKAKLKALHT